MSIKDIKSAIQQLSDKEVSELAVWLATYRARQWNQQISRDLNSGRLDKLLNQVDTEYEAGKANPL